METTEQITCPQCGTLIVINELLSHQLEEQIRQEYVEKMAASKREMDKKQEALNQQKIAFEEEQRQQHERFQEQLNQRLKTERTTLEEKLKASLKAEQAEQLQFLQAELNEKSEQVKELNVSKAMIERLKREKDEAKALAEMEAQKTFNEMLITEREKMKVLEAEKSEMLVLELKKQLEDQKRLTEEMKRKQEQGSMQLQGEVQELAIEEWLSVNFPLDTIEEIKKGVRGGDCIQTVHTRSQQHCGTIYYESKRAKEFQQGWIEKFKADIRTKGSTIGVLVTEVMPSDLPRMGMKDGIWICTFGEFKSLSNVLRESIIQLNNAVVTQENKGDKMHLLYDFLTSNVFRMQVEAIVEGFSQMKSDLESEKRAMMRIWKQREKQLDKVITNTVDMYGSIRGIAGNAVQAVAALELPAEFQDSNEMTDEDE
jgi:hypothetical protein